MRIIHIAFTMLLSLSCVQVYAQNTIESEIPAASADVAETSMPAGSVARSVFTSGIQDREPVDRLSEATTANNMIYFFTELKGLSGQTVKHRWLYQGNVITELDFNVGAPRWRVWSNKTLQADWLGTWTVEVVNGSGAVITSESIEYKQALPEVPQPAVSEPAAALTQP